MREELTRDTLLPAHKSRCALDRVIPAISCNSTGQGVRVGQPPWRCLISRGVRYMGGFGAPRAQEDSSSP
jgi:hypothetical protein